MYRCIICEKIKFSYKNRYKIIATSNDKAIVTKYACARCGEIVDQLYQQGFDQSQREDFVEEKDE